MTSACLILEKTLSVEPTLDMELIRKLATHPRVYNSISDDDCPPREEWQPQDHPALIYLLAKSDNDPVGYWLVAPHASYLWECHTVLTPKVWGAAGRELAKTALMWMWTNTPARRIFTQVPEFNRIALRFALVAGFKEWGKQPNAFLKNGRLWPVIYLGISKETE